MHGGVLEASANEALHVEERPEEATGGVLWCLKRKRFFFFFKTCFSFNVFFFFFGGGVLFKIFKGFVLEVVFLVFFFKVLWC